MRRILIALNLLVAATSAALFTYTFVARDHLVGLAEEFVIRKTVEFATAAADRIDKASGLSGAAAAVPAPVREAALNHPAVAALVPASVRESAAAGAAEFDAFRQNPEGYVRGLVAHGAAERPNHPPADRIAGWKEQVRAYFERAIAGLVLDLRIISGTNAVVGLLAAWLASRARGRWRYHVLGVSILLLLALGLNLDLFLDRFTLWSILFNSRVGWGYPAAVVLVFACLYWGIGRHVLPAALFRLWWGPPRR